MKYDFEIPLQRNQAAVYFDKLLDARKKIELKEVRELRSLSQNSYLHVVISLYGINFGSSLYEAKIDLKRMCDFMRYKKLGKHYLRETSKMDSKELTDFIDWIRTHSAKEGHYIPTSEEYITNRISIDREIESNKEYL